MSVDAKAFLERWHEIVAKKDLAALHEILAEDVTLGAPPYWNELEGREIVGHLLGLIVHTIEDFTYHREFLSGNDLALEFKGHVGDLELQGVDLISLDENGRVRSIEVPMRPLKSVVTLREIIAPRMTSFLAERAERAG